MKSLIKLLMISFLVASCGSFPVIDTVEVCAMNVTSDYCRCAGFDFNYGKLQSVSSTYDRHLEHCHKFIGLAPKDWVNLINHLDSIYVWKDKNFQFATEELHDTILRIERDVPLSETPLKLLE